MLRLLSPLSRPHLFVVLEVAKKCVFEGALELRNHELPSCKEGWRMRLLSPDGFLLVETKWLSSVFKRIPAQWYFMLVSRPSENRTHACMAGRHVRGAAW